MTYEEKLVGRVAMVLRTKRSVVAHQSLKVEAILGVALNPATGTSETTSVSARAEGRINALDRVATVTGTRGDGAVRVAFREILENVLPTLLQV